MTNDDRWLRANTPTIAAEYIDGEVVLVSFETGHYYSLRETAADIWRLLDGGLPIDEVAGVYGDSASDAVRGFIASLQSERLMVPGVNGQTQSEPITVGPYVQPVLERFEEMAEMLLYDPIHDVDQTGWPNLPADEG